jgi:hypothetical protein
VAVFIPQVLVPVTEILAEEKPGATVTLILLELDEPVIPAGNTQVYEAIFGLTGTLKT